MKLMNATPNSRYLHLFFTQESERHRAFKIRIAVMLLMTKIQPVYIRMFKNYQNSSVG